MKIYKYTVPQEIDSTKKVEVFDETGKTICYVLRRYSNSFKKLLDRFFDYRYFLQYVVENPNGDILFSCNKIARKGRMWFEAFDFVARKKMMVTYENWRLGIPELTIIDGDRKIKIEKEMEDWSRFIFENQVIAKWKADFIEEQFLIILQIEENSPLHDVAFFIAISQATLFIGG